MVVATTMPSTTTQVSQKVQEAMVTYHPQLSSLPVLGGVEELPPAEEATSMPITMGEAGAEALAQMATVKTLMERPAAAMEAMQATGEMVPIQAVPGVLIHQ